MQQIHLITIEHLIGTSHLNKYKQQIPKNEPYNMLSKPTQITKPNPGKGIAKPPRITPGNYTQHKLQWAKTTYTHDNHPWDTHIGKQTLQSPKLGLQCPCHLPLKWPPLTKGSSICAITLISIPTPGLHMNSRLWSRWSIPHSCQHHWLALPLSPLSICIHHGSLGAEHVWYLHLDIRFHTKLLLVS